MKCTAINLKRSAGFTLIEALLVGAGVSAVVVAAFLMAPSVRQHSNVAKAADITQRVVEGVEARYAMFAGYTGIESLAPGYIEGVETDGGAVRSPWGAVLLSTETQQQAGDGWSMTLDSVPRSACAEFVARVSGQFAGTFINGEATGAADGQSVAPEVAADLCAHTSNSVKLIARTLRTRAALVAPHWATPTPSNLPAWTPPTAPIATPIPALIPTPTATPTPAPTTTPTPTPPPSPTPTPTPAPVCTTTQQWGTPTIAGVHACHVTTTTCCNGVCSSETKYGETEQGNGICHFPGEDDPTPTPTPAPTPTPTPTPTPAPTPTPTPITGAALKVSSKHTNLGSTGDVATITIQNTGSGTISHIRIECAPSYSWHHYGDTNTSGLVNGGPDSLAPGAVGVYLCQAAASGSYSGTLTMSGDNMNSTPINF